VKIKATLFAVLALVVLTGIHNPVGVSDAFAQSTSQVGGTDALTAIDGALKEKRITAQQAQTLTDAVKNQKATVTVNAQKALVLGQDLAAAGLFGSGFTASQVAVAGFILGGAAVLVSGNGSTGTVATTGTTGTTAK
jgi:hypothetical protein